MDIDTEIDQYLEEEKKRKDAEELVYKREQERIHNARYLKLGNGLMLDLDAVIPMFAIAFVLLIVVLVFGKDL